MSDCTVTVARMFDVQALNDPIALTDDELAEFVSTLENAEIAEEPTELEDFDTDSIVTHYTVALSDGTELELSYYESRHWNSSTAVYDPDCYLVVGGELFTTDEESINTLESYYRETYSSDYTLYEICYAEYKHDSGEWSDVCYSQVRNWILGNAYLIANPGDYSYYSGDWSERREREKAEMDEILSTIDDILPYVLRDDGTVNEDRFVNDGEMVPYKIDEPVNPLLDADFEGATVYVMRNYNIEGLDDPIPMDAEAQEEFLSLLMSLEMDETPTVDDNMYAGGEYFPCYTIAFPDGSEYLIYFMAVSVPVGNNLNGDARYIVIGDYKYCIPYEAFSSGLIDELESYYDEQYRIDYAFHEVCYLEFKHSVGSMTDSDYEAGKQALIDDGYFSSLDEYDAIAASVDDYQAYLTPKPDFSNCTVTVTRMFDVQALNDPINLEGDEYTDFISAYKNADIGAEPTELEDFDADSVTTHYTITLLSGTVIKLSSYEDYIVVNGELFTIDEESLAKIESYFLEIYSEDYKIHEICYAEYKLESGEWTEDCYDEVRYKIPRNSFYIADPDGNYFSTGDWEERTAREQAELDEILAGIDDIMPYILKDDGTVNEDRYVSDNEMLPYKIDEPVNPLLDADFEGCAVYTTTNDPVQIDEETKNEFLTLIMSLEMDETPMVDDNFYEGGDYGAGYTIVLSDGSEYRVCFMAVSAPVGNGLSGSARYVIVNGYKYCITNSDVDDLFEELTSYYHEIASSIDDDEDYDIVVTDE
ncbi:MAG: hypothetical protein LUH18_04845 [Oscillospiraceae bacterium]|nr:hypothetical protein [Oscillospiraceae bacterium]